MKSYCTQCGPSHADSEGKCRRHGKPVQGKFPTECHEHARDAVVICGGCYRSWCERCDPAPSALCHFCHGRGHSTAELDSSVKPYRLNRIAWHDSSSGCTPNLADATVDAHLLAAWVALINASSDGSSIPGWAMSFADQLCAHFEARYGDDPYNGMLFAAHCGTDHEGNELPCEANMTPEDLLNRWQERNDENGGTE